MEYQAVVTSSARSFAWRSVPGLVAFGVLPLYLAEFIAAARASYWMGLNTGEWLQTLVPPVLSSDAFCCSSTAPV